MEQEMEMLFALFGGLAMFLYGMDRMSRALQRAAGDAMKRLLARLTATPLLGVLTGLAVTAVLQSSSAATVMVIGFAPPLYPAYHSDQMAGKEGVGSWQFKKIKKASEAAGCMVKKVHYFTGISDLSYCGTCGDMDFSGYAAETPLWGGGYQVDFEEIGKLNIPAVLMDPWGKDIHRRTERVNRKSLLVELPEILHTLIEDQA